MFYTKRPKPTKEKEQGLCLDKGYDYDEIRELVKEFGFTAHIRSRGDETKDIKRKAGQKARHWVVERTHSWMNRFNRILIRWEKRADTWPCYTLHAGLLHGVQQVYWDRFLVLKYLFLGLSIFCTLCLFLFSYAKRFYSILSILLIC